MPDISHALAGLLGGIPTVAVLTFFMRRWVGGIDRNFEKIFDKLGTHTERIRAVEVRVESLTENTNTEIRAVRGNGRVQ